MKILITGVAGFIGYSLAVFFLKKKINILGIDNFDDYYSVNYKKKRVELLKKYKNFSFKKIDISDKKSLEKYILKEKSFDAVYHFAAQPGVRYSLKNPQKYYNSNILGYNNLLNSLRKIKVKKTIYASSSSIYGDQKKLPVKETAPFNPKNFYGYSKLINEVTSDFFAKFYKMNILGMRFFSVYGEWGRPDMLVIKYLNSQLDNKFFYLNNKGNHLRDFTHIDDVVRILEKVMYIRTKKYHEVFNVCSSSPYSVKKFVLETKKIIHNIKVKNKSKDSADVQNTHGSNFKIREITGYNNFKNIEREIPLIVKWFKDNNINSLLRVKQ
jgi:UDP-glucuronate 4-epimerase